ncbi:arylamine N-acetyltransferase [Streptomyces durmitorensis]|uniref:Arylamine N-acetyltransferase n=1 Tax=Streptomyces durmitorensis TaxID=319947 RepID=A0ABY4PPW2_9ACTN|nr:arylamine N-acetyltransferase [Streptomyces durmitorensis]UQT55838.1 arylamine N-acetyltransferase [Streptomyces durmitorensis]
MTWNGEELDIEAYLARIGHQGETKPDFDTLRALHRAHVAAIPFENLEMMLGRPVPLDLTALQDKLVRQCRGGYCYEQNLLFAAVLERIGFAVTGLGARVRAGASSRRAVTHMLLKVEADGRQWHCDVGFGAEGLLEPIPMGGVGDVQEDVRQDVRQGEWRFGIVQEANGARVLRTEHADGWFDLYEYTLEERLPVDYVVMNHYTSTHPRSSFIRRPVIQRAAPEVRRTLVGEHLTVTRPDGTSDERDVSAAELGEVLVREFGIELNADDCAELIRAHYAGA